MRDGGGLVALMVAAAVACQREQATVTVQNGELGSRDGGWAVRAPPGRAMPPVGLPPSEADEALRAQIESLRTRHGGPVRSLLRRTTEAEFEQFARGSREAKRLSATGEGGGLPWVMDEGHSAPELATDTTLWRSLDAIGARSVGAMRVRWNENYHSPATLDAIGFVRRGRSPREVWESFRDAHLSDLRDLWGIESADDLVVDEVRAFGETDVVVRGSRRRAGLVVDGQYFEAYVTTERSTVGAGVLRRLDVAWDRRLGALPTLERSRWLTAAVARSRAEEAVPAREREEVPTSVLRLSCGAECRPYWTLSWATGRHVGVDALHGAVLSNQVSVDRYGPLQLMGRPPMAFTESVTEVPIRLRGTSISDGFGAQMDYTSWFDGTYGQLTSQQRYVGFEGTRGGSFDAFGRVVRYTDYVGAGGFQVPTWLPWVPTAQTFHVFNFAPNDPANLQYSHAAMLTYGWLTYWQSLMGHDLGFEIVDRLHFATLPRSNPGIGGQQAKIGNVEPLDENGHYTRGELLITVGPNDDVASDEYQRGEAIIGVGHEYAHTVDNCALQYGWGCDDGHPKRLEPDSPQRNSHPAWRASVFGSHKENTAAFIGNLLARYRYRSTIEGNVYDPDWFYEGYTSTTDDFGTESQGQPLDVNDRFRECWISGAACGTNEVCLRTDNHPIEGDAGFCVGIPSLVPPYACPRALQSVSGLETRPPNWDVCVYNAYKNQFWTTVGARLALSTDWRTALHIALHGAGGQHLNGLRDLVTGGDNYYARYLAWPWERFEVTRAVRSVYRGAGFVTGDDYTNYLERAVPVVANASTPTEIWWRDETWAWPRHEDYLDFDSVMFRGVTGLQYELSAQRVGSSGSIWVDLYRLENGQFQYLASSTNGTLPTGMLTNGWYVADFWSGTATDWRGSIRLAAGSDDYSSELDDAYPVPHGAEVFGSATTGDGDAFQIDVPQQVAGQSVSLTLSLSGSVPANIEVFTPSGGGWGSIGLQPGQQGTLGVTPGLWRWIVRAQASGTYSTRPELTCSSGSLACTRDPPVSTARFAWGDWFGGRLPNPASQQTFRVALSERETVSVGVTDSDVLCDLELEVYSPPTTQYFWPGATARPIFRWTLGGVSGPNGGNVRTPGGSIQAINAGTYEFRVRNRPGALTTCNFYRLYVARTGALGPQFPSW